MTRCTGCNTKIDRPFVKMINQTSHIKNTDGSNKCFSVILCDDCAMRSFIQFAGHLEGSAWDIFLIKNGKEVIQRCRKNAKVESVNK